MKRLYKEEMKRILRSRSTLLFLAAAIGLSVFMAWVPVTFERYTYEENGQEIVIEGREALALKKQLQAPAAGEVTPEKMLTGLRAYQKNLSLYGDFYGDWSRDCMKSWRIRKAALRRTIWKSPKETLMLFMKNAVPICRT